MAIVTEISFADMFAGKTLPDSPARKVFRESVEVVAAKAREKLPEAVSGRIDKAVQIVLNGSVELLPDDKAKVGSQTNGTTTYHLVDGTCDCRDFAKAPDHWCKHRLAYGIYKRARALAKEQLQALDSATSKAEVVTPVEETPVTAPATPIGSTVSTVETMVESVPVVSPVVQTHREAPASCNTYIDIAGRKVQLTLRDDNEENLLARMEKLLSRFPVPEQEPEQQTTPTPPEEGFCPIHKVKMRYFTKGSQSWWSHRLDNNNTWCRGK
jgi:hypothetical protein